MSWSAFNAGFTIDFLYALDLYIVKCATKQNQ